MELLERHKQTAELETALGESAAARGSLVLVTGETGVGKTVLVKQFAEQSEAARVLWGVCDELVTPRPLGPFRDMFAGLEDESDLQAFLDSVLDELNGLRDAAVVVVEDAHWADQATLDAIRFLGRRIARMRALLVVTYRDDEVPPGHPLRLALGVIPSINIRRVQLSPLSEEAVAGLARGSDIDAEQLYELTGGNPFFVTEVLAEPESPVPLSVQDAVLARVGRLGDLGRGCVELVSAVPGAAEPWLLETCSVSAGVDDAVRLGVLKRSPGAVTFSHELVRRAVEQNLTEARRKELNGEILDALVAEDSDPARLTHHAVRAGRTAAIVRYAPLAARRATAVGAHLEAFDHYRRALKYGEHYSAEDQLDLLEAAGPAGFRSAQFDDAHATTARAIALCRISGYQVRLARSLRLLAEIEWYRGQGRAARSAADEAVTVLERVSSREELADTFALQARLAMLDFRPGAAITWGDKAIALTSQNGNALPADLLVTVGSARVQRNPDGATTLADALHTALEERNVNAASRAFVNLVRFLTLHMRYEQARPYLDEGLGYLERHDKLVAIDHMRATRALWQLDQGRWPEAMQEAKHATDFEGLGHALAQLTIGLVQARRGDPAAPATLASAEWRADASGEPQLVVPVALARAEQAWLAGDNARVTATLEPILDIAFRSGLGRWIGEAALWLHRVGNLDKVPEGAAEPYALQISGRWREAAAAWGAMGRRYEEADALADADEPELLLEALTKLNRLVAGPRSAMVRRRLVELGVHSAPRGPNASTRANPAGLTRREIDVLHLLAGNLTYQAIAEKLHISIKTVDRHVAAIRNKLGVGNRNDAVEVGRRLGIVD